MKCSGWSPRPGSDLPHPGGPLCRPVCAPDTFILEISTSELDFQTFSFVLKVWFGWKSVIYVMNTPRFFFLTSWDLLQANSGLSRRGVDCAFHRTTWSSEIEILEGVHADFLFEINSDSEKVISLTHWPTWCSVTQFLQKWTLFWTFWCVEKRCWWY